MNAPTSPSHLMAQVTGTLLHAGYQYDDGLVIDLYGDEPTIDCGYSVESIAVHGTTVEIGQLFSDDQKESMGHWIDVRKLASMTSKERAQIERDQVRSEISAAYSGIPLRFDG